MAGELPKYYWLRFGDHYIVAEGVVAVHGEGLSPECRAEFDGLTGMDSVVGCALPEAGKTRYLMAAFSQPGGGVPPPAPPPITPTPSP